MREGIISLQYENGGKAGEWVEWLLPSVDGWLQKKATSLCIITAHHIGQYRVHWV